MLRELMAVVDAFPELFFTEHLQSNPQLHCAGRSGQLHTDHLRIDDIIIALDIIQIFRLLTEAVQQMLLVLDDDHCTAVGLEQQFMRIPADAVSAFNAWEQRSAFCRKQVRETIGTVYMEP